MAARAIGAEFHVISAGLGVINAERIIPSYSLTVARGDPDDILSHIDGRRSSANWWEFVCHNSPYGRTTASLVRQRSRKTDLVLMALPTSYFEMLTEDLLELSDASLCRIRIFTGRAPEGLHERLRPLRMPYDNRLDGPGSPLRGTASDFAARAMHHFANVVLKSRPTESLEAHRKAVLRGLGHWSPPNRPDRRQRTDDQAHSSYSPELGCG